MNYAISVPVGGYLSAQMRAKVIAQNAIRSVLTFLIRAVTPKPDVYIAVEGYDAEITARDNDQNELAELMALQVTV